MRCKCMTSTLHSKKIAYLIISLCYFYMRNFFFPEQQFNDGTVLNCILIQFISILTDTNQNHIRPHPSHFSLIKKKLQL